MPRPSAALHTFPSQRSVRLTQHRGGTLSVARLLNTSSPPPASTLTCLFLSSTGTHTRVLPCPACVSPGLINTQPFFLVAVFLLPLRSRCGDRLRAPLLQEAPLTFLLGVGGTSGRVFTGAVCVKEWTLRRWRSDKQLHPCLEGRGAWTGEPRRRVGQRDDL